MLRVAVLLAFLGSGYSLDCYINQCGCPGSFKQSWCSESTAKIMSPWCAESAGNCAQCGGDACEVDEHDGSDGEDMDVGTEMGKCYISPCGCPTAFEYSWCSEDVAHIKAEWCNSAASNCEGSCNGVFCPYSSFNRISYFPVYLNTDVDTVTVAEIVDVSSDGSMLIYTDSEGENLGFVDITDPEDPKAGGIVDLPGEPTSVAVVGDYALVGVNTSPDYVNPSGELVVVQVSTKAIVASLTLAGQPDSVAVSPDGQYAAVVIENERDEDLGDGEPPQLPAGLLQIVDLSGSLSSWSVRDVSFVGVADLFPEDPEPEYVDINTDNVAVVTLQENNYIILVDLASGTITNHFSAGTVSLSMIDTEEEDPALINPVDSLSDVPREPDGVTWIDTMHFAIADEGDLFGGSRGITVFDTEGHVTWTSGNSLEHEVIRMGHYPDGRSGNKGGEPENVDYGIFGEDKYLFACSERAGVVWVYGVGGAKPELLQALPTGIGPEGVKAIPSLNLLVVASEVDDVTRSSLTIYRLGSGMPHYPTIISADREDGAPIPWGALSGFAADPEDDHTVYTIYDSFYQQSRIFMMNVGEIPAVIEKEIVLSPSVNIDPEGIAVSASGDESFWIASEGSGSVDDEDRPVTSQSMLVHATKDGTIVKEIHLPESVNAIQRLHGFEGVASVMEDSIEILYVAFQRAWVGDPAPNDVDDGGKVRIGRYDTSSLEWTFAYYPLDVRESPAGGWVGLSEITSIGGSHFAIIERDNKGGNMAAIKRVYKIDVLEVEFVSDGSSFNTLSKMLVRDLIPDLEATNGPVPDKVESLAALSNGDMLFCNDNDGADNNSGETQLIRISGAFM